MGVMRFQVGSPGRVTEEVARRVYMSGLDRVPWPCRGHVADQILQIERAVSDSGNLFVPWQVDGYGEVTLSTGSLMERSRPYHLQVELARGKVNQVRTQLFDWQGIGLVPSQAFRDRLHDALTSFALAATSQNDTDLAAGHAQRAIQLALEAGGLLAASFTEQALAARFRHTQRLTTQLGVNLGGSVPVDPAAKLLRASMNAVQVPLTWHDIESSQGNIDWAIPDAQLAWAAANNVPVHAGPLIRFDTAGLPDWLYLWEGEFDDILEFLGGYVDQVVRRYRGKVQLWQCAARVNGSSALGLSEVDKQRLAVRAIEIVRSLDPKTPVILGFDQPWTEYMSHDEYEPPLYFADLLARAGIGLSGIGLEVNLGYYPGGSFARDVLDVNAMIDRWGLLGLPLYLYVTVPSSEVADPKASNPAKPLPGPQPAGCTQGSQNLWVSRFLPLLLAKPAVHGVFWNQLHDAQPHEFPHGGLFDAAGSPKSSLTTLAALRKAHLD